MSLTLDPQVATATESHHQVLRDALVRRTEALMAAVTTRRPHAAARHELLEFLHDELLPHADVEEALLYAAGDADATTLLVRAMQDEHRMLIALVTEITSATDPMEMAIAAGALVILFDVRAHQEDRYLLPALAAAGVDLTSLLAGAPEIVGTAHEATT